MVMGRKVRVRRQGGVVGDGRSGGRIRGGGGGLGSQGIEFTVQAIDLDRKGNQHGSSETSIRFGHVEYAIYLAWWTYDAFLFLL